MKNTSIALMLLGLSAALANQEALQDFICGNHRFAASIFKEITKQEENNFLISPLSAQLILALSQSGAKNDTAKEIRNALSFQNDQQTMEEAVEMILPTLDQDPYYVFHTINKIYVKDKCPIKNDFSVVAKNVYGAQIENIDFESKEKAAEIINNWVEKETDHKIRSLIDPDLLANETRAVLINALRLKANWSLPFPSFSTVKRHFYQSFDNASLAHFMHIFEENFEFYENRELDTTFLILPFEGSNISMTIALPNTIEGLGVLEERIDEVLKIPETTTQELFNVALPKFKIESKIEFQEILQNLGVKKAFKDGEADFSGIAGDQGELFINDIIQKTFIDVNENGIEAAAATFIVKIVNRNSEGAREFNVNHPFVFFIKINNLIVFVGKVVFPQY